MNTNHQNLSTMYAQTLAAQVRKDERRSKRITIIVHAIIIILALLPFLKVPIKKIEIYKPVLVEFKTGGSSSNSGANSAAAGGASSAQKPTETESAETQPTEEEPAEREPVEKVEVIETPKTTTPILTSKIEPTVTVPKVEEVKVEEVEKEVEPVEETPKEVKTFPTSKGKGKIKLPNVKIPKVDISVILGGMGKGDKGSGKDNGSGSGSGGTGTSTSGKGKGRTGEGTGDIGKGNGGKGTGTGQGDDAGDGVLTRPIIETPSFAGLKLAPGKICLNICVNRAGKVVFVEYNSRYSTIRDRETIKAYVQRAKQFKFEPDNSATASECGRMVFKIENEVGG